APARRARAHEALQACLGSHRLGVCRQAPAVREVLRWCLLHRAQSQLPRSALDGVPSRGRRPDGDLRHPPKTGTDHGFNTRGSAREMTGVEELVIAGWTGRDEAALRKHIKELEELGVKPPKSTPIFFRVAADLLTTASTIQVSGAETSGEVEFVLLSKPDALWVTVGSDHTHSKAE